MTSLLSFLKQNPEQYARAVELSKRANDPSVSTIDRMVAMIEVHDICMPFAHAATIASLSDAQIDEVIAQNAARPNPKPEYRWVQGAKVRVR